MCTLYFLSCCVCIARVAIWVLYRKSPGQRSLTYKCVHMNKDITYVNISVICSYEPVITDFLSNIFKEKSPKRNHCHQSLQSMKVQFSFNISRKSLLLPPPSPPLIRLVSTQATSLPIKKAVPAFRNKYLLFSLIVIMLCFIIVIKTILLSSIMHSNLTIFQLNCGFCCGFLVDLYIIVSMGNLLPSSNQKLTKIL